MISRIINSLWETQSEVTIKSLWETQSRVPGKQNQKSLGITMNMLEAGEEGVAATWAALGWLLLRLRLL